MPHEVALLDPRMVKVIFLVGLLLGVLGSLFLAYDLLGSQEGPLRKFLRIALPGLLGSIAIVPVYLLGLLVVRAAGSVLAPGVPVGQVDSFQVLVVVPSIGAFLGILTALFGVPAGAPAARPAFSVRDARGGFLLALVYIGATEAARFTRRSYGGIDPRTYWIVESSSMLVAALGIGAAAGLWRGVSRLPLSDARPPRFAPHEAAVGAGAGAGMILAPNLIGAVASTLLVPQLQTLGIVALNVAIGPLLIALVVGSAGAVIGGLWPRLFWWVNHVSDNRLELIGVLCILAGFAAQAVEPVVALLEP